MRIVVLDDAQAVARFGADTIGEQLSAKPESVLGLATGSSPLPLYQELISDYQAGKISFKSVRTFNLDEYLGLPGDHPQSYRHFMNKQLFNEVDIDLDNTEVPDGMSKNPLAFCAAYEERMKQAGGVDLQLLGIGRNGHIGFNEPSSSLVSRTRVKTLTRDTVEANRRFFAPGEFQPHLAITMGIGTIMEARSILLLATGTDKAKAIAEAVEGPISASSPGSILQMHAKVTVVVDREAAQELKDVAFYQYIEQEQQRLLDAIRA
ncbi:glucosamine-6-phosphate deaminase [Reinekea blandensis]|uniref:Glucosamine-6-phosphate deaminase n=1 Tax=Reinekea blandensis MED297 TaxID=314283 RepID=A4BJA2_9GAMM|nr:glucosamine-6-phosphate deaminase [Reinekea blandensis]EAR07760.1 glucosamine-6-phosphate isomerase [Reinekea sp. MED297] [Reinekea blandensis MED297]